LNSPNDFYDLSLVDGFNIPVTLKPTSASPGSTYWCRECYCRVDMNARCPSELRYKVNGMVILCTASLAEVDFIIGIFTGKCAGMVVICIAVSCWTWVLEDCMIIMRPRTWVTLLCPYPFSWSLRSYNIETQTIETQNQTFLNNYNNNIWFGNSTQYVYIVFIFSYIVTREVL
jgi:hypothetical protein